VTLRGAGMGLLTSNQAVERETEGRLHKMKGLPNREKVSGLSKEKGEEKKGKGKKDKVAGLLNGNK